MRFINILIMFFMGLISCTLLFSCSSSINSNKNLSLMHAAISGNKNKVIELIRDGANPNYQGPDGEPILGKVLQSNIRNKLTIVSILVSAYADVNARAYVVPISYGLLQNKNCDPKILLYLINHGLNVNAYEPAVGSGPLEATIDFSDACAKVLIKHGADVNAKSRDGYTPLLHAIASKNIAMVKLLLSKHADPNAATNDGITPLIFASIIKATDIAKLLLKYGANPCVSDHRGMTAASIASTPNVNGPGNKKLAMLVMCKHK